MRLIYNDALNKRIAPYLERLTKKRTSLDKETMTLLDVFMQYFNMDTLLKGFVHFPVSCNNVLSHFVFLF